MLSHTLRLIYFGPELNKKYISYPLFWLLKVNVGVEEAEIKGGRDN